MLIRLVIEPTPRVHLPNYTKWRYCMSEKSWPFFYNTHSKRLLGHTVDDFWKQGCGSGWWKKIWSGFASSLSEFWFVAVRKKKILWFFFSGFTWWSDTVFLDGQNRIRSIMTRTRNPAWKREKRIFLWLPGMDYKNIFRVYIMITIMSK